MNESDSARHRHTTLAKRSSGVLLANGIAALALLLGTAILTARGARTERARRVQPRHIPRHPGGCILQPEPRGCGRLLHGAGAGGTARLHSETWL